MCTHMKYLTKHRIKLNLSPDHTKEYIYIYILFHSIPFHTISMRVLFLFLAFTFFVVGVSFLRKLKLENAFKYYSDPRVQLPGVRWRQIDGLLSLDFGPYHTVMMSATNMAQSQLLLYDYDSTLQTGTIRRDQTELYSFKLDTTPKLYLTTSNMLNQTSVYRQLSPLTSRYGWYLSDMADMLVIVLTRFRAAVFHIPNIPNSHKTVWGDWISVSEDMFDFLGGFKCANQTFLRLI